MHHDQLNEKNIYIKFYLIILNKIDQSYDRNGRTC